MPTAKRRTVAIPSPAPSPSPSARRSAEVPDAKYFAIFEQASDAIIMIDEAGRIESLNQAAEDLTGFLKAELLGQAWSVLVPRPTEHRVPGRSRPLSEALLVQPGTYEDVAFLRRDGYVGLADVSMRTVEHTRVALLRDTSERKRMERELITQHAELRAACVQLEKKTPSSRPCRPPSSRRARWRPWASSPPASPTS